MYSRNFFGSSASLAASRIFAAAALHLGVASIASLKAYEDGISTLNTLFPGKWGHVYLADKCVRKERWSVLSTHIAIGMHKPKSAYDPKRPWDYIIRASAYGVEEPARPVAAAGEPDRPHLVVIDHRRQVGGSRIVVSGEIPIACEHAARGHDPVAHTAKARDAGVESRPAHGKTGRAHAHRVAAMQDRLGQSATSLTPPLPDLLPGRPVGSGIAKPAHKPNSVPRLTTG